MNEVEITLRDRLAAVVIGLGYEFVGFELQKQGRNSLLRVYIDIPRGINLDDCTKISRQLSAMLDVEDPIQGQYTLEVSSPGIDRPLFDIEHYQQWIGHKVRIRLNAPINNCRKWVGVLVKVEGKDIHLLVDAEEVVIPFSSINKANVIAE